VISCAHPACEPILAGKGQGAELRPGTGGNASTAIKRTEAATPAVGSAALASTARAHALSRGTADGLLLGNRTSVAHRGGQMESGEGGAEWPGIPNDGLHMRGWGDSKPETRRTSAAGAGAGDCWAEKGDGGRHGWDLWC
jgi:hypothetical protein